MIEEIYFAGGCLWGVQEFCRHLPGVVNTEAGRANGTSSSTAGAYDGYAECVRIEFDASQQSLEALLPCLFEIIDPYSVNQQGEDVGPKYRTGVYSQSEQHLDTARRYIAALPDAAHVAVEVKRLDNFVASDDEHQDRLQRCPDDYCHIDAALLHKYR